MIMQELHKRTSQTELTLHAIACSFLTSCGDSDIAIIFTEGQSQLFTPTLSYHVVMIHSSDSGSWLKSLLPNTLASHSVRHTELSKVSLTHLYGIHLTKCCFSQLVPMENLSFYVAAKCSGSAECDRVAHMHKL